MWVRLRDRKSVLMTTITLTEARELVNEYPYPVRAAVTVQQSGSMGWCQYNGWGATVDIGSYGSLYTYRHEMGHATARIMRIERELGELAMAQPGAKSETNDNIFCYGAQRLARFDYETAIAEYAADAINYYYYDREQLPRAVVNYLDNKLH